MTFTEVMLLLNFVSSIVFGILNLTIGNKKK